MSRWKAAGVHFGISLLVGILVGSLIYFVWYPSPYFRVSNGSTLILLLMGVDVAIGPLLTLVVFKRGKKGLKFDLAVIAVLQIAAFCYGIHVVAGARPVFVVAEGDRFVVTAANQLDDEDLDDAKQPEFATRSWTGPLLVGADVPKSGPEYDALLHSNLALGKDVDRLPKYYVPYAQVADKLFTRAKPLAKLAEKRPQQADAIERFIARSGEATADLVYIPLQGRMVDYAMVLSVRTKQPVTVLAIDPW
jgi:hypothetical protein